jgi:hypothetical protein
MKLTEAHMSFKTGCVAMAAGAALLAFPSMSGRQMDPSPDLGSLSDIDLKTLTIQLERTVCFGSCPAYTLTIHGDGRVEYSGKSHVKETGAREGRVRADEVRMLVSQFGQIKFWEIADEYSETKCKGQLWTDMPTAITQLAVGGKAHRVTHYYGCAGAPKSLWSVESAIDKTANAQQWTGDVSHAGPFGTTRFQRN